MKEKTRRAEEAKEAAEVRLFLKTFWFLMQQRELKIHSRSVCAGVGVYVWVCVSEWGGHWQGRFVGVHGARCTVHANCWRTPSTGGWSTQNFECKSEKSIQSECARVCVCLCVRECVCGWWQWTCPRYDQVKNKAQAKCIEYMQWKHAYVDLYRPIRRGHSCTCADIVSVSNLYRA